MKKTLLLLAGLLLVSSLASARVVGDENGFVINDKDETLTFKVNAFVRVPLAAWWHIDNEAGEARFFNKRTYVENMAPVSMGQPLPLIDTQEIYIMAPYKSTSANVKAALTVEPLVLSNGTDTIDIALKLRDKNGPSNNGSTIYIDADSAGGDSQDGLAVIAAETATNLDFGNYVGGEVIELIADTTGALPPFAPGAYSGVAKIIVSLHP